MTGLSERETTEIMRKDIPKLLHKRIDELEAALHIHLMHDDKDIPESIINNHVLLLARGR